MPKASQSSRRWLREHLSDPYVKQAKDQGFRSRAVFKLQALQEKDRLFRPGMTVVDLGAAPGSWSQYVLQCVGKTGRVIALDCLPLSPPLQGIEFIQGDFREASVADQLLKCLGSVQPDLVLSDMAHNFTGISSLDQARSMELAELALDFAERVLPQGGSFLVKVFQGVGFDAYLANLRDLFEKVVLRKPKASRDRSKEVYLLARNVRR